MAYDSYAVWYRPPDAGERASIDTLRHEWESQKDKTLGAIIVGDMNVHHASWLRFSARISTEGQKLETFCDDVGLRQIVKSATRGDHLLDLALTDLVEAKCRVLPRIADHSALWITLPLRVPKVANHNRLVWQFAQADWEGLRAALAMHDWSPLTRLDVHDEAEFVTDTIVEYAKMYFPRRAR